MANPDVASDKSALEGWSPVRYRDSYRNTSHVELVSGVTLDDDASGLSTERVAAIWSARKGAVYTTYSSTPEHPKHRVHLCTTRDMTPSEYPLVWQWCRDHAA
ncbi:MAG: hypothetical protein JOZ69_11795, partial [Myxococcales bacterium]|nr:hypothetical protein [Myxococcales bacterium]